MAVRGCFFLFSVVPIALSVAAHCSVRAQCPRSSPKQISSSVCQRRIPQRSRQALFCVNFLILRGETDVMKVDLELRCRRVPPFACRARGCHYVRGVLSRRRLCAHSVRRQHCQDLELRHRRVPPYACRAQLQPQSLRASRDGPPRGITLPRQLADRLGA